MSALGVHSEVGKLRKVIVHRPELSLRRLTPANHDELLFDDVLWVERAQWEHDQFVECMRTRGVEVFYVQDLLTETLQVSEEGHWWMRSASFCGTYLLNIWPGISSAG
jgi:arginine deiminase